MPSAPTPLTDTFSPPAAASMTRATATVGVGPGLYFDFARFCFQEPIVLLSAPEARTDMTTPAQIPNRSYGSSCCSPWWRHLSPLRIGTKSRPMSSGNIRLCGSARNSGFTEECRLRSALPISSNGFQ